MTRGRFKLGKEPSPFKWRSKQLNKSNSARSIWESNSTLDGETSPRNFRVKCIFSIGTQRTSASISFRNLDVAVQTVLRISRGISTAMNARRRLMFSCRGRLTAQGTFHSFLKLQKTDGLGEIGGSTRFHAISDIRWHALRGDDYNRDIGKSRILPHLPKNIKP